MDDKSNNWKTSSAVVAIDDLIIFREYLKDSKQYFEKRVECSPINAGSKDEESIATHLYNESQRILDKILSILNASDGNALHLPSNSSETRPSAKTPESGENTSYLDMSVRAYESYDKSTDALNSNEYVDVTAKPSASIDDDNIYDNYIVEYRKHASGSKQSIFALADPTIGSMKNQRKSCPFNGLPAAHFTIVQSPKTGWLTMHLRRKRISRNFSLHFKRRYYAGLVMEPNEADVEPYNWWLLLYVGGTSELKPTVCLPLNRFTVSFDHTHDANTKPHKMQKIQCKFEMNEQTTKKDGKSLCLLAESPEHCEQWIDLIRQLSAGKKYIENVITATAQIRKLPMLPIAASMKFNENVTQEIDTVDTATNRTDNAQTDFNNSDGVYEEPEDYYKNVKVIKSNMPKIPAKKASQSTASTLRMDESICIYDTPKSPVRATAIDDKTNAGKSILADELSTVDSNRLRLDEVRTKLTTQFKGRTHTNLSYACSQTQRSDDQQTVDGSAAGKYQLSIVRRFTNHLAKIRHSTNPTSIMRKTTHSTNDQSDLYSNDRRADNQTAPNVHVGVVQKRTLTHSIQPKGNKVHMIINQLEANGQLTLLNSATNKNNILLTSS